MTSRNHHRITIAYQSHRRLSCEIICLILSNIWLQLCMCRSRVTITWPDGFTATSRTRMAATVVNRPFLFHQIWSQRVLVLSVMHRCARKRGKTVSPTRLPFQSMGSNWRSRKSIGDSTVCVLTCSGNLIVSSDSNRCSVSKSEEPVQMGSFDVWLSKYLADIHHQSLF